MTVRGKAFIAGAYEHLRQPRDVLVGCLRPGPRLLLRRRPPQRRAGLPGGHPYVIAYVELEEGPRVLTNIVGCDPGDVRIGMQVSVVFHDTWAGTALYRFAPSAP
jgi:hypothetical protein